jgi:hypothetical protein
MKLGVIVNVCNPSTWRQRPKGVKFKASLAYIVRPCLKRKVI